MTDTAAPPPERSQRSGLAWGLAAYGSWGLFPIYFKAVAAVPPLEVLAHRIVWSVVLLAIVLTVARCWPEVAAVIADPRTLAVLVATTLLIAVNWLPLHLGGHDGPHAAGEPRLLHQPAGQRVSRRGRSSGSG